MRRQSSFECVLFYIWHSTFCKINIQGLVISIIYGFANEDVQNVLRTHWKRRMLVRMVKREGRERTVSLKVSVRDMGDMGDAGDHSNITQLTVTWAHLNRFKVKILWVKIVHPKGGFILNSDTGTDVRLKRRSSFKFIFKIYNRFLWIMAGREPKQFSPPQKTNCDVFKTCQYLDVKKYIHFVVLRKYATLCKLMLMCTNVYFKK